MKSFTSLEQSQKLAKILPLESADMYYHKDRNNDFVQYPHFVEEYQSMTDRNIVFSDNVIPCWSLAALLSVLPKDFKSPFGEINPFVGQVGIKDYRCVYLDGDWASNIQTFANNPIDACYEMILKLHDNNLL